MENSNKNKFMERANSLSLQKAIIGISTKTDIRNITPTICLVFDSLTLVYFLQVTKIFILIIFPDIDPPQNKKATAYAETDRLSSKSRNGIISKLDEEIKNKTPDIILNTLKFIIIDPVLYFHSTHQPMLCKTRLYNCFFCIYTNTISYLQ